MKKLFILLFLIIPILSFAEMIGPSTSGSGTLSGDSQIVVNSLWESSGHESTVAVKPNRSASKSDHRSADETAKKADLDESSGKELDDLDDDSDESDDFVDKDEEDDEPDEKDSLDDKKR